MGKKSKNCFKQEAALIAFSENQFFITDFIFLRVIFILINKHKITYLFF